MNLATAGSEKRAKEIGVRKALGSGRQRLIFQFIGEAMGMALLAGVVAVVISFVVSAGIQFISGKRSFRGACQSISFTCFDIADPELRLLVAGSYPALYLSSFNPIFVLKGIKLKTGASGVIRKGLVVVQFAVSIILIISTIIIYQQIQHVKSRDIGYNKENLIQIAAQDDVKKEFFRHKTGSDQQRGR